MTTFNFNGYANRQQQGKFMQIRAVSSYWERVRRGTGPRSEKESHENTRWQRKGRGGYSIFTEGGCLHRPLKHHACFNVSFKVENQEFQHYTTGINSAFLSRDAGEHAAAPTNVRRLRGHLSLCAYSSVLQPTPGTFLLPHC